MAGGFRYLGLSEMPNQAALHNAIYGGGVISAIVDAVEWIVNAVEDVIVEVVIFFGTIDSWIHGSVSVDVDFDVLNRDPLFAPDSVLTRACGRRARQEIAPDGARVVLFQNVIRAIQPIPLVTQFRSTLTIDGRATLNVARDGGDFFSGGASFNALCVELGTPGGLITTFLMSDDFYTSEVRGLDFKHFRENSKLKLRVSNRKLSDIAQLQDSHDYVRETAGVALRQAKMMTGNAAWHISIFQDKAWAPCFGFGDQLIDAAFGLVASLFAVPIPVVGAALLPYMAVLLDSDIVITEGFWSRESRSLIPHEYGHYALCGLTRANGHEIVPDIVLTLDTVAAENNGLELQDEARLLNEAFADFMAAQISSSLDYANVPGQVEFGKLLVWSPGLDANETQDPRPAYSKITQIAAITQDVFDGSRKYSEAPNNADSWERVPGQPGLARFSARQNGDTDDERVSLAGSDILTMVDRFKARRDELGSYRYRPYLQGLADVVIERNSWCDACRVVGPHFAPLNTFGTNNMHAWSRMGDLMRLCSSDPELSAALGEPPVPIDALNASACVACPVGYAMGQDGRCTECPVDRYVDFANPSDRCGSVYDFSSTPGDRCPDSFRLVGYSARLAEFEPITLGMRYEGPMAQVECVNSVATVHFVERSGGLSSAPLAAVSAAGTWVVGGGIFGSSYCRWGGIASSIGGTESPISVPFAGESADVLVSIASLDRSTWYPVKVTVGREGCIDPE